MKEYILTFIGVALAASAVILLSPVGKNGGILKHVRFLAAIALICVLAEPIVTLVSAINGDGIDSFFDELGSYAENTDDYDRIFYESISKFSADELQTELKKRVCDKFGIEQSNIDIRAEYVLNEEKIEFRRILITLSGAAVLKNPREIEEYVKGLTNVSCDCVI